MNKLQETIEAANLEVKRLKEIADKELAEKLANDKIQYEKNVEYWRIKLTENDYLFNLIKEAVIKGEKSVKLDGADHAAVQAIRDLPDTFEGIHAYYDEYTWKPSDECTIDSHRVIVTWK